MKALNLTKSFRNPTLLLTVMACLNSAQAHPGHAHDGGVVHTTSHGLGWLAGVALVAFGMWAVKRVVRVGARVRADAPDSASARQAGSALGRGH